MKIYKKIMFGEANLSGRFPKGSSIIHTAPATNAKKYIDEINIKFYNESDLPSNAELFYNYIGEFNLGLNNTVQSIAQQSDGKILLGGNFTSVGGVTRNRIARVFENGDLDTTFDPNVDSQFSRVESIVQQSDGKILLGGSFTSVGGTDRDYMARVFENGDLDTAFDPSPGDWVYSIVQQSDGKILLGGSFTSVSRTARNRIARVFENGDLDTTFNPNVLPPFLSFIGDVSCIVQQSNGKILFAGRFGSVQGVERTNLARVFENGDLDTTFDPDPQGRVFSIFQQSDGKILLGGNFTFISETERNCVARVFENGDLDTTFDPNTNGVVWSVFQQSDGKILLGGDFTSVGGVTRNRMARVFENGDLDTTFNPNADNDVRSIVQQSDGKILLGGDFTFVSESGRSYMTRLGLDGSINAGDIFDSKGFYSLAPRELKDVNLCVASSSAPQNIYFSGPSTVFTLGHVNRIEEEL
jgi:uncharacterized delta-60 repeat protein